MNWLDSMNKAVEYLEDNITEKLDIEKVAKIALSSTIPTATWAVFESVGALPEAIQDLARRIFTEWLPSTGYQHDCAPELEVYPEGDLYSNDYKCEIWIPIKK